MSLDPDAIARKLVDRRRGGYCFEHNLLFKRVLEELGAKVEPMLARVRNGQPATTIGPLTHLLLRVEYEGAIWHVDVGFGQGTLLEPIPFGPGGPYEQSGWSYRVAAEGELLVLQTATDEGWRDLYAFRPEPVPAIDIELSNWFTCTHPQSRFVTRLLVTEHGRDGSRTTLSDFSGEMLMSVQTPTGCEARAGRARRRSGRARAALRTARARAGGRLSEAAGVQRRTRPAGGPAGPPSLQSYLAAVRQPSAYSVRAVTA